LRLAVISPFVDRRHGTERCLAEQLERFSKLPELREIHLYSQRVEDLPGVLAGKFDSAAGKIFWHKVSRLPGPHLLGYIWWLVANRAQRWWDARIRGLQCDLLYSPGINAFDADAISIHVVFHEFYSQVRPRLRLRSTPLASWLVVLHRQMYYRLICLLESWIYKRKNVSLSVISRRAADCVAEIFGRESAIIPHGVDLDVFNPGARHRARSAARVSMQLAEADYCVLLIGNDWRNKGLDALLKAVALCPDVPLKLLVVGSDDQRSYKEILQSLRLEERVHFAKPSREVLTFYAAADAYVGPSLEDAYGLPIIEAMACGLPVVASGRAGVSEIITHSVDGFILQNPEDENEIAALLRRLAQDRELCARLAGQASQTASRHSWDRNAADTWAFLKKALEGKGNSSKARARKPLGSISS
jgi:UDP-glucose:(heptosyl)LPS alpha-1,3-glucosyltransferase